MANVELHREPVFGLSITPYSSNLDRIFKLAKTADDLGLDIIGIQDHPYNGSFLDTWTLISTLAASTKRIRYFPDVSDLPMRPPAILAKTAATLDIITKGRIELGLGTGAFWDATSPGAELGELLQKRSRPTKKPYRSYVSSGTMARVVVV